MGTGYGALGSKPPTASLVAVMILGAMCFGALWLVGAQQYQHKRATTVPAVPGNNMSGAQSPNIQNNSGTIVLTNQSGDTKERKK